MAVINNKPKEAPAKRTLDNSIHRRLVEKGASWLRNKRRCQIVLTDINPSSLAESPDVIGFKLTHNSDFYNVRRAEYPRSILIEAKASRSDFLRDSKKPHRQSGAASLGQLRYYLAPQGLLSPAEMPPFFGLLELNGRGIRVVKEAEVHPDSTLPASIENELLTVVGAWNSSFYKNRPASAGANIL